MNFLNKMILFNKDDIDTDHQHSEVKCTQIWVSCFTKAFFHDFPITALEELFRSEFLGQVLTTSQELVLHTNWGDGKGSVMFNMTVKEINRTQDSKMEELTRGLVEKSTIIRVFASDAMSSRLPPIYFIREGFSASLLQSKLNKLQIGGMALHMKTILEGIFGSDCRHLPESSSLRLATRKGKGVLLYGGLCTGKTLLASNIHKILGTAEPKILDCSKPPKTLDLLFGEAIRDAKINRFWNALGKDGKRNQLHLFILKDLDRMTPGARCELLSNGQTFAALMESLDNILIIATTSSVHKVHPAYLRPGLFELKVNLDHLSEDGRLDVLKVFTRPLIVKKCLKENELNLAEIAFKTDGYRAIDLQYLVNGALLCAMERFTQSSTVNLFLGNIPEGTKVSMEDFYTALELRL